MLPDSTILAAISARGVVQGVGFRPFVYQLARKYGLKGWVCNTSEDVKIEVEGPKTGIERFYEDLQTQTPPLSHIESISISYSTPKNYSDFEIRRSIAEEDKYQLISPDIATCEPCKVETFSPQDRRYRYPFTNCTNCGPRFTIIQDIPYDRPRTTMNIFTMCPDCQQEYDNPLDRRFHAQPNACPVCGPRLELLDDGGVKIETADVINTSAELLLKGNIIAIKGLGGFLLACDATSDSAVNTLRSRKKRPSKPFAIMVANLSEAKKYCEISLEEEKLLASPQSPIVLLRWKKGISVCSSVAPGLKYLGVMIPYTPLHHLLLDAAKSPLVMTSGNISEEPIAKDNDEAIKRLSGIADYFVVNNRDIYARYDDSVTCVELNNIQVLRRARGYAPFPIHLSFTAKQILAAGADEKNTFCLTRDNYAFVSQHIGDMENLETLAHLDNSITLYRRLFRMNPEMIAHDLHPDYLSTKYALDTAKKLGMVKTIPIQHHHAHIASCMADNQIESPVIGVALDGTGYGSDGRIWGSEFMVADFKGFTRMGHLEYLPLPGGETAIKRPYRIAAAYLYKLLGKDTLKNAPEFWKRMDKTEMDILKRQLVRGLNAPLTSSMGRLFDAVSSLIGIRDVINYEAQAAIELEMAAYEQEVAAGSKSYPFSIIEQDGIFLIILKELLSWIAVDLSNGTSTAIISARFHNTIAQMIWKMCHKINGKTGIDKVALSGGVFQNRLLLRKAVPLLAESGFTVLLHKQVPCNDGGIALGQAVIANFNQGK